MNPYCDLSPSLRIPRMLIGLWQIADIERKKGTLDPTEAAAYMQPYVENGLYAFDMAGQGHETAFPQIVADMLGVDPDNVEIVHGDTSKIPFGMGTYGSRSLAVCGSAIVRGVEKIISKGNRY